MQQISKIMIIYLIFPNLFVIIFFVVWRDVRDGRRSMIGNHVYGNHRTRGSNPLLSAKTPIWAFFLLRRKGDSKATVPATGR